MIGEAGKRVLSLSLDSGGSYTDAVVMDIITKEIVAKIKSKTTHDDIIVGMKEVIDRLLLQRTFNPSDIKFVGLSTTLATNSILESKGGKVGLIRIGWEPYPDMLLPTVKEGSINGGHNQKGEAVDGISDPALIAMAKDMEAVSDCIVISSKFACLKDSHERLAKQALEGQIKIPVIAAYELSSEIGVHERTNTAILNGMLLPVIDEFIQSVTSLLSRYRIDARIMMMRGDGTLMKIEQARTRPVETIMSGPAASVVGGQALSGKDTCVVVDIGSTSTDIAILRNGLPPISKAGATILGKGTHVKNMDVRTIALGGDSHIRYSEKGGMTIGPNRAVPLATAAAKYPVLLEKLKHGKESSFVVPHKLKTRTLTSNETAVLEWVKENAPCTVSEIQKAFPLMHTMKMVMESLMTTGSLIMTGLTPTDLMVIRGDFDTGLRDASVRGLSIEAAGAGMMPEQYMLKIMNSVAAMAGRAIIEKILSDETGSTEFDKNTSRLMDAASGKGDMEVLNVKMGIDMPIVGLGGPAKIFLTALGPRLGTEVIIPENFDVGNAMGTVHSKIAHASDVMIFSSEEGGYELRSSFENTVRSMYIDEAIDNAVRLSSEHSASNVERSGGINISVNVDRIEIDTADSEEHGLLRIRARATGDPLGYIVGYHSSA